MRMKFVGVVAGLLLAAPATAQDMCQSLWANSSPEQIAQVHTWAVNEGFYDARTKRYALDPIATKILNHVQTNCSKQFAALGMDSSEYVSHMIRSNFRLPSGQLVTEIPHDVFIERLRGHGMRLGLPAGQAPKRTPTAQKPSRPASSVIPGCPSCTTRQSH